MPTEKELLGATVNAAGNLFKKSKDIEKIGEQLAAAERREEAQAVGSAIGATTPEEETTPLV